MYKSIVAIALFAIVAGVHSVPPYAYYPVGIVQPVVHRAQYGPGDLGVDIGIGASRAGQYAAGLDGGHQGWGRPCCGLGASFGGAITAPGIAVGGGVRGGVSLGGAGISAGLGLRTPGLLAAFHG